MDGTWRIYSRKQETATGSLNYIGACLMPGQCPQEYYVTRIWTATDDCDNTATASTTINVVDTTPPVITCPEDITVTAGAGEDQANINVIYPTAIDNCTDENTFTGIRSDSMALNDPYPVGITTISWTAMDDCGNISDTCTQMITVNHGCIELELYVYLEGAMADPGGTGNYAAEMRTSLNDLHLLPGQVSGDEYFGTYYSPPGQPYNGTPWNYSGNEGNYYDSGGDLNNAVAGYPSTVVDWVLVSLRAGPEDTGEPVCQAAALLHKDGSLEFISEFCCETESDDIYYVVIEHRNHLIVMSHEAVSVHNGKIIYDFRNKQSYINDPYGYGSVGQKEVSPGKFVMIGGNADQSSDVNSDTDINVDDNLFWRSENGTSGKYLRGDYNMDGDTNANDKLLWQFNNGEATSVPRN